MKNASPKLDEALVALSDALWMEDYEQPEVLPQFGHL